MKDTLWAAYTAEQGIRSVYLNQFLLGETRRMYARPPFGKTVTEQLAFATEGVYELERNMQYPELLFPIKFDEFSTMLYDFAESFAMRNLSVPEQLKLRLVIMNEYVRATHMLAPAVLFKKALPDIQKLCTTEQFSLVQELADMAMNCIALKAHTDAATYLHPAVSERKRAEFAGHCAYMDDMHRHLSDQLKEYIPVESLFKTDAEQGRKRQRRLPPEVAEQIKPFVSLIANALRV
jgi:hypothetical protein